MMNLRLVKLERQYQRHLTEMLEAWLPLEPREDFTPRSVVRNDYHDFTGILLI